MGENKNDEGGREANRVSDGVGGGERHIHTQRQRERERILLQTGLGDLITVKH